MNRTYAAKRLLEHGPLTTQEFTEITGWKPRQAIRTLHALLETGVATYQYQWTQAHQRHCQSKTRLYALASLSSAEQCGHLSAPMPTQPTNATERICRGSISRLQNDDHAPKITRAHDRARGEE